MDIEQFLGVELAPWQRALLGDPSLLSMEEQWWANRRARGNAKNRWAVEGCILAANIGQHIHLVGQTRHWCWNGTKECSTWKEQGMRTEKADKILRELREGH